jgi:hypothetical protein
MAAGLAVAAGLEQKPYAPLLLCGRTAITCFGDIVVSDNSASWFKPTCVSSLLENHIRISPHEEVLQDFPSCVGASACNESYNGPIDLWVKQREFISLVGGAAARLLRISRNSCGPSISLSLAELPFFFQLLTGHPR